MKRRKIIIAPLNWGLGHATRCVPIIKALIKNNFTPIIASDGIAFSYLKKEFPNLESLELPAYNISYSRNLKVSLMLQIPKILKAVQQEKAVINNYISKNSDVIGIISDNRFGARSTKVTSVYITHQLNILTGVFSGIASKVHQKFIKKFDECWIPDTINSDFSGKLSILKKASFPLKYIGILSRFQKKETNQNIDILAIISGVEPNRTHLENKLKTALKKLNKKTVLVCGKVEKEQKILQQDNLTVYNFALSKELEELINSAKLIICRSGYSSIMDLAVLQKKAYFIPTKGQTEQEYLAKFLSEKNVARFSSKEKFNIKSIENSGDYSALSASETKLDSKLFSLFKRK